AAMERATSLDGTPVVWAPLHSMVAPIAAGARSSGMARVTYVMTDGAALPASFSRLVARLRETGLLDAVVTSGHAYGGGPEAVTALLRVVLAPVDVAVPVLAGGPQHAEIWTGLEASGILDRHRVTEADGSPAREVLAANDLEVESMGRTMTQDPAFFLAAGAA